MLVVVVQPVKVWDFFWVPEAEISRRTQILMCCSHQGCYQRQQACLLLFWHRLSACHRRMDVLLLAAVQVYVWAQR